MGFVSEAVELTTKDIMAATASPPVSLPGPTDRPEADILIFDGECRFCTAQIRRLHAMDTRDRLAYLSLHDPETSRRWPELTYDELMDHMVLVDGSGRQHAGAAAFRYLSRKLPRLWWLAPLMHIPGSLPLWQFIYRQIAKIRYRFGRVEACEGGCSLHFD